jgi:hypothetical protein
MLQVSSAQVGARAWSIFAAVSTLWGIPYLFIKLGVDGGLTPATLAWGRVVLGAAVLLALAARAGALYGVRGRWRWLAAYAVAGGVCGGRDFDPVPAHRGRRGHRRARRWDRSSCSVCSAPRPHSS